MDNIPCPPLLLREAKPDSSDGLGGTDLEEDTEVRCKSAMAWTREIRPGAIKQKPGLVEWENICRNVASPFGNSLLAVTGM